METQAVNYDSNRAIVGDIAASNTKQYGAVLALADRLGVNLLGVWQTATQKGRVGVVKRGRLDVNCTGPVAIGDRLYISDTQKGKATNIKPTIPYYIGYALSKGVLDNGEYSVETVFDTQVTGEGVKEVVHGGTGSSTPAGARTNLGIVLTPTSGIVPAFVANAASIAPGTAKASLYPIAAGRTLAAASSLTITTAGTPCIGNKVIACYALTLGYVLSVVNGGPAAGTLGTFPATLTKPLGLVAYWNGANYIFNQYIELDL